MQHASRVEERVVTQLPVSFGDGSTGITRNISASGIYFEADRAPTGDYLMSFAVEFQNGMGGLILSCQGQVLRIEQLGDRIGVAARILESRLAPAASKSSVTRLEISDGFADSF